MFLCECKWGCGGGGGYLPEGKPCHISSNVCSTVCDSVSTRMRKMLRFKTENVIKVARFTVLAAAILAGGSFYLFWGTAGAGAGGGGSFLAHD